MIGIIGYGFVGSAVATMKTLGSVVAYDKYLPDYQNSLEEVINQDFVFLCVPTNPTATGALDISIVEEMALAWGRRSNQDSILIIKSTIPVGTVDHLQQLLNTDRIVFNPEFLTERTAHVDFLTADETIVGGHNVDVCNKVLDLYRNFLKSDAVFRQTTPRIAELTKIARNSLYAVKIEFMNEIYDLCQAMNIDYDKFRHIFAWEGKNAWVGDMHTYVPGPDGQRGFGGKCLPKDISGLRAVCRDHGVETLVMDNTIDANPKRRQ